MTERKVIQGDLSGLHWEIERCPDCRPNDAWKPTLAAGFLGYGAGALLGASGFGRLILSLAGVGLGRVAAKYHLNIDWDPDKFRGTRAHDARPKVR